MSVRDKTVSGCSKLRSEPMSNDRIWPVPAAGSNLSIKCSGLVELQIDTQVELGLFLSGFRIEARPSLARSESQYLSRKKNKETNRER